MSISTITWGIVSLPAVAEEGGYDVTPTFIGTRSRTANASQRVDEIAVKDRITMKFPATTTAERSTILGAYTAYAATATTLTGPDARSWSVVSTSGCRESNTFHDARLNDIRIDITIVFDEV